MRHLSDPETPFAVVDATRVDRNITRLRAHLDSLEVPLRLHVKTAKSVHVAARVFDGGIGPITVSTLAEAEYFAAAGFDDIIYAVGIAPHKLGRVAEMCRNGVSVTVLLDSSVQADAVVEASEREGVPLRALIEIDADGHRGGVQPDDPALVSIGRTLDRHGLLAGVLTHAGESYFAFSAPEQLAAAKGERDAVVSAAMLLRAEGLSCETVSLGSTPTAHTATDLEGVTEVRAGNFVFFDLVMAGLGVCDVDDLALSVVVTVIGHQTEKGWILTDGGWMATSRDRGTAGQAVDQGYGVVTDLGGAVIPDLVMTGASQEHGVLSIRHGSSATLPDLPVGTRLRILPNHACATAAQYPEYQVIHGSDATDPVIVDVWPRLNGW